MDVTSNDIQTKEKNIYSTYQAFALTDKQMKASGYSWYDSKKCKTNRYEKVYFYAPNYNKNIHYILDEYVNHIDSSNSIIKNISSDVYPYQYYNPTEGEWKDSCWVEINIEY